MDYLSELENRSIYVIREAYKQYRDIGMLWSIGKDSSTLLWLCRKAFFGKIPFPVIHIDTTHKFPEIYQFRDEYAKKWGLKLLVAKNEEALAEGVSPKKGKFECCNRLKTEAFKQLLEKNKLKAVLLAIRRDEHGIRAKERYMSVRSKNFEWCYKDQPPEMWDQYKSKTNEEQHVRVHPMLHWTEYDIWRYIQREKIPITQLYFSGYREKGKRYRSIGCECCCAPIASEADTIDKIVEELRTTKVAERSGRAQDKESTYVMAKLRVMGYM